MVDAFPRIANRSNEQEDNQMYKDKIAQERPQRHVVNFHSRYPKRKVSAVRSSSSPLGPMINVSTAWSIRFFRIDTDRLCASHLNISMKKPSPVWKNKKLLVILVL